MLRILRPVLVVFLLGFDVRLVAQKIERCEISNSTGGKYSIAFEGRPVGKSNEVLLDIILKPKNFTRAFMTEFVARIKGTYCHENIISIAIFDDKVAAVGWNYDWVISKGKVDRRRGTYYLNKLTGKDSLEFST